jgi:RND superfamily putative drug exporter
LVLAELGIYRVLGPGLALALCIVFVVTLTLVPALLAILGPAAFGRRSPARRPDPSRPALQRRSGLIVGVIVAGLIFASAGNLGLRVGFDQLANLPDSAASVRGYEELSGEFPGASSRRSTCLCGARTWTRRTESCCGCRAGCRQSFWTPAGPR